MQCSGWAPFIGSFVMCSTCCTWFVAAWLCTPPTFGVCCFNSAPRTRNTLLVPGAPSSFSSLSLWWLFSTLEWSAPCRTSETAPPWGKTAEQGFFFYVSSIRSRSRPLIIAFGGPRSDVPRLTGWFSPVFLLLSPSPVGVVSSRGGQLAGFHQHVSSVFWRGGLAACGDPMPLCPWVRRALRGSCLGSYLREGCVGCEGGQRCLRPLWAWGLFPGWRSNRHPP